MSNLQSSAFPLFVHCLKKVPDPRSKHSTSHPFVGEEVGRRSMSMNSWGYRTVGR